MSDWQMRRIESPDENPCCALVREVGPYKATVHYTPESQTWSFDVMHGERMLHKRDELRLLTAVLMAGAALSKLERQANETARN